MHFFAELGVFEFHRHKIGLEALEVTAERRPQWLHRRQIAFVQALI